MSQNTKAIDQFVANYISLQSAYMQGLTELKADLAKITTNYPAVLRSIEDQMSSQLWELRADLNVMKAYASDKVACPEDVLVKVVIK